MQQDFDIIYLYCKVKLLEKHSKILYIEVDFITCVLVVLYMAWLPFEDKIVGASEKLVLKYSPNWSGAGRTIYQIDIPDCYKENFEFQFIGELYKTKNRCLEIVVMNRRKLIYIAVLKWRLT